MDQPLDVPRIPAGERFTLRPWQLSDLDLVREASNDELIPLITTVPSIYSESEGIAFIERQWARSTSHSGYPFVIVRITDGQPVGMIGLWLRNIRDGRASLGYWVVKSARGQGAAGAALQAVTSWAQRNLRIPRLELYIEPGNTTSLRTAESAGFQREGLLRSWQLVGDERRDMFVYSMLDTDPRPCLPGQLTATPAGSGGPLDTSEKEWASP